MHKVIPVAVWSCVVLLAVSSEGTLGAGFGSRVTPPAPDGALALKLCDKYAAPWGRDGGRGTAVRPFRTAQWMASSLRPGETGCLRAGTYSPIAGRPYVLDVRTNGFRIRSFPRERARVVGIVVVRSTASSVALSDLDVEGDGTANTVKIYGRDITIEDDVITNHALGWSCMILGSNEGWGQAVRPIVRRNTFHDCGNPANDNKEHAIYAQSLVDGRIIGNVFWRTAAYAIQLYPNAQRTLVAHNVVDGGSPSARGGIVFGGDESYTSNDNLVAYNVISDAVVHGISSSWAGAIGTGNVARDNCLWRLGGGIGDSWGFTTSGNLVASPLFRDQARRAYRLGLTSRCLRVVGYDAAARLRFAPLGGTDDRPRTAYVH